MKSEPQKEHTFPVPGPIQRLIAGAVAAGGKRVIDKGGGAQSGIGDVFAPDLIPPEATLAIAAIVASGAKKYARNNWRRIPFHEQLRHARLHLELYAMGDKSEPHLWHALTRLAFAVATENEDYDFREYEPLVEEMIESLLLGDRDPVPTRPVRSKPAKKAKKKAVRKTSRRR